MRCAIFLCLCVLIFVSLVEARSFNRESASMKDRFLSKFASRHTVFDKKTKVPEENEGGEVKDGIIKTATLDVLAYAVGCMLDEPMWQAVPKKAWEAFEKRIQIGDQCEWSTYWGNEYYHCLETIVAVHYYVKGNPTEREQLDGVFRMFTEAIKCAEMEHLGEALKDSPQEFVHTATDIMSSHCEKRGKELDKFLETVDKDNQNNCQEPQEGADVEERDLLKKLTDLLATDLSRQGAHKRSIDSDYEISYAGFEAIAFAGHCVKDEDSSELCSKTIEGVRKYVTAIQEEDDATVDKMENIFLNYGEQFKCGVLGHIRDEVFRALTRCDTITHKVISENIEIILGINDMVTDHCGRRNSELAEMEAGFEQENKRKLLKQALFDLHKKK